MTTGTPGIFVINYHAMAVTNAVALRLFRSWLGLTGVIPGLGSRRPLGHDHRARRSHGFGHRGCPLPADRTGHRRTLSVHMPLHELAAQLNEFRPALLAAYPSIAKLLAGQTEHQAGANAAGS